MVLKPAPDTPWVACELGRLAAEHTDLPPGVLQRGDAAVQRRSPAMLVTDPRIDLVSFTGSTATGRAIMAAAAPTLKKVFLELGGKSAAIVLDDADLAAAVGTTAFSVSIHAGQGCALTTRLVVPRDRYDEAVQVAADTMASIGAKDPTDPGAICGPVISAAQRDRVERYLDLAVEEGGRFATGGHVDASKDGQLSGGFWIEPTVIAGLDNSSRVAQEEIFGPVLVVIPHDGDDDAVRIANESPYGLSGSVDCGSLERAAGCRPDPHRHPRGQRRRLVQPGRAVRRLQAVRHRPRDGCRRVRGVPRDEDDRRQRLVSALEMLEP